MTGQGVGFSASACNQKSSLGSELPNVLRRAIHLVTVPVRIPFKLARMSRSERGAEYWRVPWRVKQDRRRARQCYSLSYALLRIWERTAFDKATIEHLGLNRGIKGFNGRAGRKSLGTFLSAEAYTWKPADSGTADWVGCENNWSQVVGGGPRITPSVPCRHASPSVTLLRVSSEDTTSLRCLNPCTPCLSEDERHSRLLQLALSHTYQ